MKSFIRKNSFFLVGIMILLIISISYKLYKISNIDEDKKNKEIVTVILKNNEIIKGLPNLVNDFNEERDDIFIKLEFSSDDYNNVVYTKLANEKGIDIIQYIGKTLMDKEFIQPLDNINIDYSIVDDGSLLRYNDDVMGVKYGSSMPKLMYNNDILRAAKLDPNIKPNNLDELIIMLEKIRKEIPDIQPLDISMANIHDLFGIVGTISSNNGTIYPTFWDYEKAEYDYEALKPVLQRFKYMYENYLINIDFDEKKDIECLEDFQDEKSAVTFVNSSRKYSVVDRSFNLDVSFSDIPFINNNDGKRFYYTSQRILSISNNVKDKELLSDVERINMENHENAVREVFEWLLSEEVTNYLVKRDANFATFGNNPFSGDERYNGLNNNEGYYQSEYDPTEILAANAKIVQDAIYSTIKGDREIDEEISKLKESINTFILSNGRNDDIEWERYKE